MANARRFALSFFALTIAACGGAPAPVETAAAPEDPVARGQALCAQACAGCHGADGSGSSGAPALVGEGALSRFATAADIWEFVQSSMPPDDPGSLGDDGTGAVVAFALSANGVDPGEGPFTREEAAAIRLGP